MAKTNYTYKYNGVIVRNSNNVYQYGLVNHNGAVIKCSGTEKGALAERTRTINFLTKQLNYYIKHKPEWVDGCKQDIANTEKWHVVELEVIKNF